MYLSLSFRTITGNWFSSKTTNHGNNRPLFLTEGSKTSLLTLTECLSQNLSLRKRRDHHFPAQCSPSYIKTCILSSHSTRFKNPTFHRDSALCQIDNNPVPLEKIQSQQHVIRNWSDNDINRETSHQKANTAVATSTPPPDCP